MDPYKHRPSSGNNSSFWTTNSGTPVWNNNSALTIGQRGPILLECYHLIEKLAQFDRKCIPERVVHARGASAKGFFEVTHDVSHLTCAAFLWAPGVQTPVIVRLSTVVHERGSPKTLRDPLCFAVKFYTREPTPPAKTPRWSHRCSACPPDGGVGCQDRARPRQAVLPQGQDPLAGRHRPGAPHLQRPRPHRRRAAGQDLPRLPAQVPLIAEATTGALRLWLGHPRPHPRARTAVMESRMTTDAKGYSSQGVRNHLV